MSIFSKVTSGLKSAAGKVTSASNSVIGKKATQTIGRGISSAGKDLVKTGVNAAKSTVKDALSHPGATAAAGAALLA